MSDDGYRADWAQKDFYAELGVKKDASAEEIKKAYRKLARANHPDSNPGDTAKHDKFKAVAEAYDVLGDRDKRAKYDEFRSLHASGRFGGFPGGGQGGQGGFNLEDLLRDRGGARRRLRRHVRRHLRRRGLRSPAADASPAEGRRRRDQRHDQLHRRHRRRHHLAAADLRRALPGLQRHRRQARHQAARVSGVRGRRLRHQLGRRRVLHERDLPDLRWAPARVRRGLPHLPRLRARAVGADHPGPHPRRRQGRPADPAARQGRGRRERRPGRRPLRHRQGEPAPRLRSQGRQPHPRRPGLLRRARARLGDQGPHPRRRPGHPAHPCRHPQRAHLPGARQGCSPQRRHRRRPARHRRGASSPRSSTRRPRAAVTAYREATAGRPLRANLFEKAGS